MGHNWPSPGGSVDPVLKVETPMTAAMLREVPAIQSFRFYQANTATAVAFPAPVVPATDPVHEAIFIDQGRTNENFDSSRVLIVNDGPGTLQWSYDGVTLAGTLYNGETKVDDERRERWIFFRKVGGDAAYRVWAW
jgi:hypothetical protein